MPFAFIVFFVAMLAEGERAPFDLLEAESEIVAGFNIEYSGMKFAWFFLQFFVNSLLLSAIAATIFLGGWQGPFVDQYPVLGIFYFGIKTTIVLFALMWVRATYPRLRIDQMMTFCWKVLVPASLVTMLLAATISKLPVSFDIQAILLIGSNILALIVTLGIIGATLRRRVQRRQETLPTPASRVQA
jgi:NADH-quinone oxidoreductase subunit H